MRERSIGFGAAKRPGKSETRDGKQDSGEKKKHGQWPPDGEDVVAREQGGAHGVESIRHGIDVREELQPVWKNRNGKEHAAHHAGNADQQPLCRISSFEKQKVACGENSETGEREKRGDQNGEDGQPVGVAQRKTKENGAPAKIDGDAESGGEKRVERGADDKGWQGGLGDEQVLEGAGVTRFLQAAIKSVEGSAEIVEIDKPDQGECKVRATLRQGFFELGTIDEHGNVIKHRGAKESFDNFHDEAGAVGTGDGEIATEEQPKFAQDADHRG